MKINKCDPSIVEFEEALNLNFCKEIIRKFNKNKQIIEEGSVVGPQGECGVNKLVRQTQVLNISGLENWKEEDKIFFASLAKHLDQYLDHIIKIFYKTPCDSSLVDSGYEIQKTIPRGFYTWHVDAINNTVPMRKLTYMWYLNSCEEGCTEFAFGQKIKPEAGKLLIFPSTWPYVHQGTPPKTTKYVCTGWLS